MNVPVNNAGGGSIGEYLAGQTVPINATIRYSNNSFVTNTQGNFNATVQFLQSNTLNIPLTYSSITHNWSGQFVVPSTVSGLTFIDVQGSGSGIWGNGIAEIFTGDFLCFDTPIATDAYSINNAFGGMAVGASISYLNGTLVDNSTIENITLSSYSILSKFLCQLC